MALFPCKISSHSNLAMPFISTMELLSEIQKGFNASPSINQ